MSFPFNGFICLRFAQQLQGLRRVLNVPLTADARGRELFDEAEQRAGHFRRCVVLLGIPLTFQDHEIAHHTFFTNSSTLMERPS